MPLGIVRPKNSNLFLCLIISLLVCIAFSHPAFALSDPGAPEPEVKLRSSIDIDTNVATMTINDAVEQAVRRYPTIVRAQAQVVKSGHDISLAKTEYLPRVDMLIQGSRATQNVSAGTILPQFLNVIPIQSGPAGYSSKMGGIFNNNEGLNFSWELVDFGRRAANVSMAKRGHDKSRAVETLTKLDVVTRAADNYLKVLMARRQIAAFQAALDRMKDWALVVHTLCDKGLKAGVDASRADAEVSMAKIGLIQCIKESELLEQDLAESLGMAGTTIRTIEGPLVLSPKAANQSSVVLLGDKKSLEDLKRHPLALMHSSEVDVAKAKLHLLDRTWYPHLWYESAVWGRGSSDRNFVSPVGGGIVPTAGNWAVGLTLQFPIMDYYKVKAQKGAERSTIQARLADYDLAMQELIKQDGKARIVVNRAQEVADETSVLVKAALENEMKAKERYRVGLTNVMEVADAERILAKAQVEDAVSQTRVWQAMLQVAYTHGDITPFLKIVAAAKNTNPGATQ